MDHIYKVEGMSCNGCKVNVENTLAKIHNVSEVHADLNTGEVHVVSEVHLAAEELQEAIERAGLHYTVLSPEDADVKGRHDHHEPQTKAPASAGQGDFYCP